ncbi:MAG: hypothetical protein P8I93_01800 [Crocinitomicaceae bacterium]|nr:hypothetical protein [Crocinitomicaceae bacterium]
MKKIFLSLFLFCFCTFNCFGDNHVDSLSNHCEKYKQEIKELYEDHYGKEFKNSPEMKSACIDYIERKIDGKEGTTYKKCNFFVTRRFEKEAFQSNKGISKEDVLFADFRLEFVEDNLNDPRFNYVNADKIHVEIGEYKDYVYVVVGVTSSWYEENKDLLNYN